MKYRKLDAEGDYSFGRGPTDFLVDVPEAVAQAVGTRLRLYLGEWFLDTTEGTDWFGSVLGKYTVYKRDAEMRSRIAGTQHLTTIDKFNSTVDPQTRAYSATVEVSTDFGSTIVTLA